MLRADLPSTGRRPESIRPHRFEGDARLIVARQSELSPEGRAARLVQSRRRAQVAARRALELDLDLDVTEDVREEPTEDLQGLDSGT